ncbi:molecular chaperone TorD family protein [Bacillus sp. B15-48]|uniref:TorD/DmsD family molecular chaperone n=1 Tax=Bacillus sp. B15-48 TaxID=1548601 RepID=UPI00193F3625|nr:molecular chaperone TorD family protein [Bacillus sp. B15-48]MBM4763513.1 dehydrogenase [Bacillus sp. B15-48]
MIQQKNLELTDIQDLLELRIFAYDLLRRTFLAEPTKEFVSQIQNNEFIALFPFKEEHPQLKAGVEQVTEFFKTFTVDEHFEQLHWDYTRMFIGPYQIPAPIWESAYVNKDGLLFQEETLQVRRLYLQNNLALQQESYEPEDHLGLELDFMYQLSSLLTDLVKDEKIEQLNKTIKDQHSFIIEHLLNWSPIFCENVNNHADTDFYKGMVKILSGFLNIDKICLEELLAKTKQ